MVETRIPLREVESYHREILEQSVIVTTKTAAAMLAVTPRTVCNYVRQGKLQGHSISPGSKGLRILASSLRDFVRNNRLDLSDLDR